MCKQAGGQEGGRHRPELGLENQIGTGWGEEVVVVRAFYTVGPLSQTEAGRKAHSTHQHMWGTRGRLSGKAERQVVLPSPT